MVSALRQRINKILQQLLPRTFIYVDKTGAQSFAYKNSHWQPVAYKTRPHNSFFGQETLLIPTENTLFKVRTFPCDQLREADLLEAIELDIASWSPWPNGTDYYCWPERKNENWQIAIWIWDKSITWALIEALNLAPTHIMPSQAFNISAIKAPELPCIYIGADALEQATQYYAVLEHSGAPACLSVISNPAEAKRFWAQLNEDRQTYSIYAEQKTNHDWLPEPVANGRLRPASLALPKPKAHRYARQTGVQDWSDAFTWLKPISQLVGLYLLWLLGSALILWQQGEAINEQVRLARGEAIEVVEQRENIERIHNRLIKLYKLRAEQTKFEQLLAVLSVELPEHAWLDAIQYDAADGGWIDILGKSPRSGSLAAVLEALPQIEHAMFLNDIRKDQLSGLEVFKIRLKLASMEVKQN